MTVMEGWSRYRKVGEFRSRRHVVRQNSEYNWTLLTVHFSTWRVASTNNGPMVSIMPVHLSNMIFFHSLWGGRPTHDSIPADYPTEATDRWHALPPCLTSTSPYPHETITSPQTFSDYFDSLPPVILCMLYQIEFYARARDQD